MPCRLVAKRSALSFTLGCLILVAVLAAVAGASVAAAPAGTQTVTTTADAGPGSLRQAIADAAPGDIIDFALTTPATVTLTSGQVSITKPLTIAGPGPDLLAISGNDSSRVFRVDAPGGRDQISVTLSGLTIQDGRDLDGGGLWSDELLTLTNVTLWGNRATREGGGLYTEFATPSLTNVAFAGNMAHSLGGGMHNEHGNVTLTNLTFTANRAHRGGGIYNTGSLTVENSILWNNRADDRGDQIDNGSEGSVGSATIARSDVEGSGGSGPGWDPGLGSDGGGNLDADPEFLAAPSPEGEPSSGSDLRLWFGSPAIDAGENSYLPPGLSTDLAGRPRIVNGTIDMGAYEAQPGLYLRKTASDDWSPPGRPITYTLQVANAYTGTVMTGAVLSDLLPPDLEFAGPITLDPPGAGLVGAVPPVLVTDLTIQPGQVVTVTLPVTLRPEVTPGVLVNSAQVTSTQVLTPSTAGHDLLACDLHVTVTSDADGGAGSLREAIDLACPRGTIDFALSLPATITLLSGELRVMRPVTVAGPGPELLAVSGNQAGRVILAKDGGGGAQTAVNISGITIRDGRLTDHKPGRGSGVWNSAALTMTSVTLFDNWTTWSGGGLHNAAEGRVVLNGVTFQDNHGGWRGGAMYNFHASAILTDVIFAHNSSEEGGGIYSSYSTLTLTHGLFEGNSARGHGGGLYNYGSSPVLSDVTFRGNSAAYGGGIAWPSGNVMTDMVFEGNSATESGGGIYGGARLLNAVFRNNSAGESGGGLSGGGTLTQVIFEGNSAGMSGGGMDRWGSGTSTLTHVTFRGNSALLGGGMAGGGATLDHVTFEGNRAETRAGGLDSVGASILRDVTFRGNLSPDGGGMFNFGPSTLINVVFEHNEAYGTLGFGGGMGNMLGSPSLVNVLFYNNRADYGGGMANQADYGSGTPPSENITPTLTNVTFGGNVARIAGGAIYNLNSDSALQNSILWMNQAISGTQIYNEVSTPTLAYCDIEGSGGSGAGWDASLGTDLGGNLDVDPWFRDPVDPLTAPTTIGDLHLRWGSPAIDAGYNDLILPGVTTDLDGHPRIVNNIVDLGAYESQSRFAMYLLLVFKNSQP